jgi:hypothetical protein
VQWRCVEPAQDHLPARRHGHTLTRTPPLSPDAHLSQLTPPKIIIIIHLTTILVRADALPVVGRRLFMLGGKVPYRPGALDVQIFDLDTRCGARRPAPQPWWRWSAMSSFYTGPDMKSCVRACRVCVV